MAKASEKYILFGFYFTDKQTEGEKERKQRGKVERNSRKAKGDRGEDKSTLIGLGANIRPFASITYGHLFYNF